MADTVTIQANVKFDEYKNLMTDDLKKIKSKFNILLKKAYDERTTSLFPVTGSIHKNIFEGKELEDAIDDQKNFHESYEKLQKFVIYTYLYHLPTFEENKELIYKNRAEMDDILKTFVAISENDYNSKLNEKKNLIKKFEDGEEAYWDGIKKIQKRSKKSRSRKKSKKRSPSRKRKSPAKYLK